MQVEDTLFEWEVVNSAES